MYTINDIKQMSNLKAVIVLYGKDNCGKTLTLKQIPGSFTKVRQSYKTRYIIDDNNNTIVICTAGDKEETIVSNINFAVNQGADIFVTAARISKNNSGKILKAIEAFVEQVHGYNTVTIFINKEEVNQRFKKSLNTATPQTINSSIAIHNTSLKI